MDILGIDIGGSGIKGALVDVATGELTTERLRIDTPQPSKPKAVINVVRQIVNHFNYEGSLGIGFPAIVRQGITRSAANIDDGWINYPAAQKIAKATNCQVSVCNDADVAALAEVKFGAGQGQMGSVLVFTLGNRNRQCHVCGWQARTKYGIGSCLSTWPQKRCRILCNGSYS